MAASPAAQAALAPGAGLRRAALAGRARQTSSLLLVSLYACGNQGHFALAEGQSATLAQVPVEQVRTEGLVLQRQRL